MNVAAVVCGSPVSLAQGGLTGLVQRTRVVVGWGRVCRTLGVSPWSGYLGIWMEPNTDTAFRCDDRTALVSAATLCHFYTGGLRPRMLYTGPRSRYDKSCLCRQRALWRRIASGTIATAIAIGCFRTKWRPKNGRLLRRCSMLRSLAPVQVLEEWRPSLVQRG
ncbi:hypothetical protein BD309DRAFT_542155 [Dichomitus squalens]|nr:hypothetical protein BD309DRAFT_542155 [Dichomitus squalens]